MNHPTAAFDELKSLGEGLGEFAEEPDRAAVEPHNKIMRTLELKRQHADGDSLNGNDNTESRNQ